MQSSASRIEQLGDFAVPDVRAPHIFAIDFADLHDRLGKPPHVISDLDHTLREPSGIVTDEVHDLIEGHLASGTIASFSLATNNPLGHRAPGAERFERVYRPYFTRHGLIRKPDSRFFEPILRSIDAEPADCVMIGNDVFTDIQGGNQLDMTTIQVEPLGTHYLVEFCRHHRGRRVVRLGRRAAELVF